MQCCIIKVASYKEPFQDSPNGLAIMLTHATHTESGALKSYTSDFCEVACRYGWATPESPSFKAADSAQVKYFQRTFPLCAILRTDPGYNHDQGVRAHNFGESWTQVSFVYGKLRCITYKEHLFRSLSHNIRPPREGQLHYKGHCGRCSEVPQLNCL